MELDAVSGMMMIYSYYGLKNFKIAVFANNKNLIIFQMYDDSLEINSG